MISDTSLFDHRTWVCRIKPPHKKTHRSLPKGIERFAAFTYTVIAKPYEKESEDIHSLNRFVNTYIVNKEGIADRTVCIFGRAMIRKAVSFYFR